MAANGLSRHLVYGRRGIVCSNSPLAASAGIKVMQEGGNAFDAALYQCQTETTWPPVTELWVSVWHWYRAALGPI